LFFFVVSRRNGAGPAPLALLPHALEDLRRAVWLRLQGFDDLKAKGKVRLSWDFHGGYPLVN
jgi:hypothetical protein